MKRGIKIVFLILSISLVIACAKEAESEEVFDNTQQEAKESLQEEDIEADIEAEENTSEEVDKVEIEMKRKEAEIEAVNPSVLEDLEVPKPNLSEVELTAYTRRLFLEIARYPDKIDDYKEVFEKESLALLKEQEWYYANPEQFYDWALGGCYLREKPYEEEVEIKGLTSIENQQEPGDLELENIPKREGVDDTHYREGQDAAGTGKWTFTADWKYTKKTGKIEVTEFDFSMTYFGKRTSEGTVYPFP